MRQKILLLLIMICVIMTACGNANVEDLSGDSPEKTLQASEESIAPTSEASISSKGEDLASSTSDEVSPSLSEELQENEVVIIMSMYSTDDSSIEDYVGKLNSDEGVEKYQVYDESHYSFSISEKEREKLLEEMTVGTSIKDYLMEQLSDADTYKGAFVDVEYDTDFKEFAFYVNKEKYDEAGFSAYFAPLIVSGMLADSVQAYALVPIEERGCTVRIIDSVTQEIIYDSSEE